MTDFKAALAKPLNIETEIRQYRLDEAEYIKEELNKYQIFIHHTAGNPNPFRVVDFWDSDDKDGRPVRVATPFVIGGEPTKDKHGAEQWKDGEIIQCFSSKHWAYHLGLTTEVFAKFGLSYKPLDKNSIGIEINNWGGLKFKDGKYFTYVGTTVDADEVIEYEKPFRGYKFYQKYTPAQIESTVRLIKYLCEKFNIPKRITRTCGISAKRLYPASRVSTHIRL